MKSFVQRMVVGLALAGAMPSVVFSAEQEVKSLPTLLIKGEVVSVDTTDAAAPLLKVKDRYGFETPIYVEQGAKIAQGDAAMNLANLTAGTPVEVEYNFDVNTAKRHAVAVKIVTPPAAEQPAAEAAPAESAPPMPAEAEPMSSEPSADVPAPQEDAAPTTP